MHLVYMYEEDLALKSYYGFYAIKPNQSKPICSNLSIIFYLYLCMYVCTNPSALAG